jgi:hypothetical protein
MLISFQSDELARHGPVTRRILPPDKVNGCFWCVSVRKWRNRAFLAGVFAANFAVDRDIRSKKQKGDWNQSPFCLNSSGKPYSLR